jgi:hypothetical protein
LPSEVLKSIIDFLTTFEEREYRRSLTHGRLALSRLSRVCREFATTLRPLLFKYLRVDSRFDITFLREIVRSTGSGWLVPYVQHVTSCYKDNMLPTTALFPHLPSIQAISYWPDEMSTLPHEMRSRLSRFSSLRCLDLRNIRFPSSSAFLRLVGAVSSLEQLRIEHVNWESVCEPDQPPDCKAGFCNLKHVEHIKRGLEIESWLIGWMFAAAATGYSYRRRRVSARNPELNTPPADIGALMQTVRIALNHLDKGYAQFMLKQCPEKGDNFYCVFKS